MKKFGNLVLVLIILCILAGCGRSQVNTVCKDRQGNVVFELKNLRYAYESRGTMRTSRGYYRMGEGEICYITYVNQ